MSRNIYNIFVCHMDINKWHGKTFFHVMEFFWHGKILFDKPWNILPRHIHGLFWNEQWLIDYEHGFGQESHQK
jgi:hypothetical protein